MWAYIAFVSIIFLISFPVIERALISLNNGIDPSEIVLDELVGFLVTFIGIPLATPYIVIGFLLFRFFDISKFFGVHKVEAMHGARGIILDDVLAGIYSNVVLHFLIYYGLSFA